MSKPAAELTKNSFSCQGDRLHQRFLDAVPGRILQFVGASRDSRDGRAVYNKKPAVEADGAVGRGDRPAEIIERRECRWGAKGQANLFLEFARRSHRERLREAGGGIALQARAHGGVEGGGNLGMVIGRIDGAAGEDQHARHEAVVRRSACHQKPRSARLLPYDQQARRGTDR